MKPHRVILILFSVIALHAQQESGLTLRSDTRLVEVDTTVRDSAGKPVEGLQQSDFTITDNGKPRAFTIFSANRTGGEASARETRPETLPVRQPRAAGVFANTGENPKVPPGQHSTVILMDGVNGWFDSFAFGSRGIQGLMDKLPRDERIAVYVMTKFSGLLQLVD